MKYFRDVDTGFIVRKPDNGMHLEYSYNDLSQWTQTESDSSYEREYWLGEGNTCLFEITEEEAISIIYSRRNSLHKNQILSARKCYLFSDNIIYIVTDEESDITVYYMDSKDWDKRSADSFWWSMDLDSYPYLFIPISNKEAVDKIFSYDEPQKDNTKLNVVNDETSSSAAQAEPNTNNFVEQMVDGIVGKESKSSTEREKEIRRDLSGRAWEYLMFLDDDD